MANIHNMTMKISINKDRCAGCGFCASQIANTFILDKKNNKASLRQGSKLLKSLSVNIDREQEKNIERVAKICPMQAIKIKR
jgi:ferredoxin